MWSKVKQAAEREAAEQSGLQTSELNSVKRKAENDQYVIEVSAQYLRELGEEVAGQLLRSGKKPSETRHYWRGRILDIWETKRTEVLLRSWTVVDKGSDTWMDTSWDRSFHLTEAGRFLERIYHRSFSEVGLDYEFGCHPMYPEVVRMVDGTIQSSVARTSYIYVEVTRKVGRKTQQKVEKRPQRLLSSGSGAVVDETSGIVYVPALGKPDPNGQPSDYEELSVKLGRYFHRILSDR